METCLDRFPAVIAKMTERDRLEQELRLSEERFRTLTNAVPQLIWINSPAGETEYYNDRWHDYTGTDASDGRGTLWYGRVHLEDLPRLMEARARGLASGEPYEFEYRLRRHSGEHRWHICRVVPFRNPEGGIAAWFGTATDIHDRKLAEEALREADGRKDEFLATLAHELRNPLAPIRNAVEILRVKEPEDPDLRWARDVIDRQAQQLTRLVDDLLDVSRITRGTIELRRERVELGTLLERAVETSRPAIEAGRHQLTVTLPEEPLKLEADLTRIAQVLSNLLNNAAKYTRPGGHIHLSAGREGGEAVIRVRDDGIGIPPAMLSSIFEMFMQADTSLDRAQGGLGIGLTIAKRLVEMHGGTIAAASEGRGSELTVRLPLAPESEPVGVDGRDQASASPGTALRILVVDDNEDAAETLAMLLRLAGNDVHTVHDGPGALTVVAEQRPHVVFLDIGMPGMNGFEVASRLRQKEETRDVLLVALTGWGQEEDRRRSKEAGFDHHLVKPLDPKALDELLARAASGQG
jgi:two-component system CheB/CheR fusion protein